MRQVLHKSRTVLGRATIRATMATTASTESCIVLLRIWARKAGAVIRKLLVSDPKAIGDMG